MTDETKQVLFGRLKTLLSGYCPPLKVLSEDSTGIDLRGNVPAPYGSKKTLIPGMHFAAVKVMKGHVGLYYFAQYLDGKEIAGLIPHMSKTLKGKSCFILKKESDLDEKELHAMLKKGIELYRDKGYIH